MYVCMYVCMYVYMYVCMYGMYVIKKKRGGRGAATEHGMSAVGGVRSTREPLVLEVLHTSFDTLSQVDAQIHHVPEKA